jgi:hypothetical protein
LVDSTTGKPLRRRSAVPMRCSDKPAPVQRRGVDQPDARVERGEHGVDRRRVVERRVEVAERRAAEARAP